MFHQNSRSKSSYDLKKTKEPLGGDAYKQFRAESNELFPAPGQEELPKVDYVYRTEGEWVFQAFYWLLQDLQFFSLLCARLLNLDMTDLVQSFTLFTAYQARISTEHVLQKYSKLSVLQLYSRKPNLTEIKEIVLEGDDQNEITEVDQCPLESRFITVQGSADSLLSSKFLKIII